ncbi:zinc transporter 2 [Maylandia zebra]|uniref:Probable proton-coupled zinc antiporter SLC30A3 n=4 Tax=Haplochromini TaxID=319058 RepID=A0A3P9BEI8_9CICH|nr:zinc transporter 2 [Maylandia zebra]XP_026050503.1 zinc transporter 2-like [Astatotilapia calliptera]XP_039873631.1 zinc transporter 2 [Simochromis diagramma]XP_042071027.1 zinc transporter 2 [Haplochromis burtoni]
MDNNAGNSEKSHLIDEKNAKTYSLKLQSSFPDSKEHYSDFPLKNGGMSGAIELKRPVGTHCHGPKASACEESVDKLLAKKKLYIASAVCLVFMIGEVIGGYLAHSLAIMTDAAHLLTDFGSMMVSLFSLWISSRPPTKTMNFGWHRSEILGAFISVMSIWIVTGALVYLAIERIVRNDYEIDGHVMLVTSGCAVIVNIVMAYILHHSTTFHAHGSGYHQIDEDGQSPVVHGHSHALLGSHGNTSVRAAFIHVVGDLLQSVGVMVAATIIYFRPEYKVADPICTFLFSVFVLCTTVTILRDVFRILMEGSPKGIEFNSVKEVLLSVKAVKSMHCLHLWALTLGQALVSVHLAVEEGTDQQSVLQEATDLLHTKFGFYSITIQVELYSEDMSYCSHCQDPSD